MGKELVISSTRHETQVAVLEDDQLVEICFQRSDEYSLAGSIHKGRVTRVLPGMQSAFVDIGLERDAFLYVSDFFEENEEYDKMAAPAEDRGRVAERTEPRAAAPAAAPPPASEAASETENKDRRARRSRRRRNRGRGFPDAKYASSGPAAAPEAAPEAAPAEEQSAVNSETDFAVLPGESLAKYRPESVEISPNQLPEMIYAEPEPEPAEAAEEAPEIVASEPDVEVEPPAEAESVEEPAAEEAIEEAEAEASGPEADEAVPAEAEATAEARRPNRPPNSEPI